MVNNVFDLQRYLKGYLAYTPINGGGIQTVDANSSGIDLCRQTSNGCYSNEYVSITQTNKGIFNNCIKIKALQNDPKDSSVSIAATLASDQNFKRLIPPSSSNKSHIIFIEGYYYQEFADTTIRRYGWSFGNSVWNLGNLDLWTKVLVGIIIHEDVIKFLARYNLVSNTSSGLLQHIRIDSPNYYNYIPLTNSIMIKAEENGIVGELGTLKNKIDIKFMTSTLTDQGNPEGLLRYTGDTVYIKDWKVYMFENDDTFPNFDTEILGNSNADIIKLLNQKTQRHFIFQKN